MNTDRNSGRNCVRDSDQSSYILAGSDFCGCDPRYPWADDMYTVGHTMWHALTINYLHHKMTFLQVCAATADLSPQDRDPPYPSELDSRFYLL